MLAVWDVCKVQHLFLTKEKDMEDSAMCVENVNMQGQLVEEI